jgi:beta-1,4-mannosyltransferase
MSHHLIQNYGLNNVSVLMDRPPKRYFPLNRDTQDLFLQTLAETRNVDRSTTKILVTSTSYTADEPLEPLLTALSSYSDNLDPALPNILLLITGRGPMQEGYRKIIAQSPMADDREGKCQIRMLWLKPEAYPKLLACADLGISLHKSSSGMDFPMKIIDLYGCGVPVCAANFDA